MTSHRLSTKRVLFALVGVSLFLTLVVVRRLHNQDNEDPRVFKFEQRAYFPNEIPGNGQPIIIKSPMDFAQLKPVSGEKHLDPSQKLIYETSKEVTAKSPSIPRIIHQTWPTYNIPKSLMNWVKTFAEQNPDFEYWLWSDEDALNLIKKKYPEYLELYQKYPKSIQRADVMRYFVLHQFGGFYSDLDISSIKSLEPLRVHTCIVSREPWVHAKVYWGLKELLPCNAFLASAPEHPFMEKLIKNIPMNFERNKIDDVMDKTGPMMVDRMLKEYMKEREGNFTDSERLYLAEPNLFHPRFDPNLRSKYIQGCDKPEKYHLNENEIKECAKARKRSFRFVMPEEAYTDHHWMHFWIGGRFAQKINPSKFVHIKQVVPGAKDVSEIIKILSSKTSKIP